MSATVSSEQSKPMLDEQASSLLAGVILAALACLPVAGVLLIAQVLPQVEQAFRNTPQLRLQSSIMLTIPALAIALTSWASGWLSDRMSKKKLLLSALFLYAALGLAPLLLDKLSMIIVTRAGMGLAEGVVLACSTAMIGDLYYGAQRERLLSLQTSIGSIAAVVFAIVGGALGEFGWRTPFWVYSIALVFVPAVLFLVPVADTRQAGLESAPPAAQRTAGMPWAALLTLCAITLFLSLCFYIPQIQAPFLLNRIGVHSPGSVGLVAGLANAAVVLGTLCFALLARTGLRWTAPLCFLFLAVGLFIMSRSGSMVPLCTGIVLASFGGGLGLPTFLNGAMRLLRPEQRGLGSGLWQSSFWSGQFLSPVLVVPITAMTGGLTHAVATFAALSVVVASLLLVGGKRYLRD